MKLEQIINQLRSVVPLFTDLFSDAQSCTLTFAAGTVTCVTGAAHGLSVSDVVTISGALSSFAVSTMTRVDNVVTVVTVNDHDLTEDWQPTIAISGAVETDYNGVHTLETVPNRRTFTFTITTTPTTPATGTILMTDPLSTAYGGSHVVTAVNSSTEFEYEIGLSPESPAGGVPVLNVSPRISGGISEERIDAVYTEQGENEFWMFCVHGDSLTSRNRGIDSDAIQTLAEGQKIRVRSTEALNIYVFCPSTETIAARQIRDVIEVDVKPAIVSALLGFIPDSVFSDEKWCMLAPTSDGFASYNGSYYVHRFDFERSIDLVVEDGVDPAPTRAWRDTQISRLNEFGETIMQTDIDMDDVPLP